MAQPPIDRHGRRSESRGSVIGMVTIILGAVLLFAGARLLRTLGSGKIQAASEWQLIHAATVGGLERGRWPASMDGNLPAAQLDKPQTSEDFCPT